MSPRKKAKLEQSKTYFTGTPCKHGHISKRYTQNGKCCECARIAKNDWYADNRDYAIQYIKDRRGRYTELAAIWRNKNRPKCCNSSRMYIKSNPEKVNAWIMKRHSDKLRRTPKWIDADDLWIIKEAYALANLRESMFGFSWHVDHIIPLRGKFVSGLHVPLNLQVIPAIENMRKHNKHESDVIGGLQ